MRIFALQTNMDKLKAEFMHEGEEEVITTHYHALAFFFAIVREIIMTVIVIGAGIFAFWMGFSLFYTIIILSAIWFLFVFFNFLKAWIDWCYDIILVTTDKIVLFDQTSIFHRKITPIHIENIGSVAAETQFGGIFAFGCIHINLKEGEGGDKILLRYVPNARMVASKISAVVTEFQRRQGAG